MNESEKLTKSIVMLFDALSDAQRIVRVNKGGFISFNTLPEPECFLIHQGYLLLRRPEDQLIIGNLTGPTVFGFNTYQDLCGQAFLEAITDVDFEIIPASCFYTRIACLNLWEPLLDITMFIAAEQFRKHSALGVRDSWSIICNQLNALIDEPDFVRASTSTYDYIHQRTHLSRSGIMKYLAILRKQKLIEMDNGILRSTNRLPKTLP